MFPLHISPDVLKECPQFSNLLVKLQDKLTPTGVSQQLQEQFDLVQQNLFQSRYNWLMNSVVINELSALLTDLSMKCVDGSASVDEKQLRNILSKALAFSEIEDCLNIQPSMLKSSTLFGLTVETVRKHNSVKHHLEDIRHVVLPLLEDRLKSKCEELYNFCEPNKNSESVSDDLLLAKAQLLPAYVEQKKRDLARETESLTQTRARRDEQFWMYYQKLLEGLAVMETLIKEYKLSRQADTDAVTVEWLQDKCDALFMKIRLTKLKIKCDTYTAETVKALKKIRQHLDSSIHQTEKELASTSQSLEAYYAVGTEFKYLVEQFMQLQHEIENRKWGLQHLSQPHG